MSVAPLFCKARRWKFKYPIARFVTSINFSFYVKFIPRHSLCLLNTLVTVQAAIDKKIEKDS